MASRLYEDHERALPALEADPSRRSRTPPPDRLSVLAALAAWRGALAPDAVVAFHDYDNPAYRDVREAAQELGLTGTVAGSIFGWPIPGLPAREAALSVPPSGSGAPRANQRRLLLGLADVAQHHDLRRRPSARLRPPPPRPRLPRA